MAAISQTTSAADFLPSRRTLASLERAARTCQGCPLYAQATQTVFGEGPDSARVIFVGEQPGDTEDRAGRPFVGPAGRLFDQLLAQAGIAREQIYVTNAVKHFKWTPRGKRRLHAKPSSREIMACRPWLEEEIAALAPDVLVCLGATAAQALFGRSFALTKRRGQPFASDWAPWTMATFHPSALLRAADFPGGQALRATFEADLQLVAGKLKRLG
jgi:uracil-DNA glycosylase